MVTKEQTAAYFLRLGVLFVVHTYKKDLYAYKLSLTVLSQKKWYRDFGLEHQKLKEELTKLLGRYQNGDVDLLSSDFKELVHTIQTQVASIHYVTLSHLMQALVEIDTRYSYQSELYAHFLEVFAFLSCDERSPMNRLGFEAFCNYIEALMIYASVDNNHFNIHQNEALLILNEIKSYVQYKPLRDTQASELFFALINRAEKNSKNHLSTRFEGVVKSSFKVMDDEQDAYFIEKLQALSQSDGVHSTQEKLFDTLITNAKQKVAPFEAKEREAIKEYERLVAQSPFTEALHVDAIDKALSSDALQNIIYSWKMVQKLIIQTYAKYYILDVNKKTFFFLYKAGDISQAFYEYLLLMESFVKKAGYVNYDRYDGKKIVARLSQIYNYFLHLKRKRS